LNLTKKILVIDDSRFTRKMISLLLEEQPEFEVVGTADDGIQGLAMIKAEQPDAVTVDLDMPNMDGLTMLRELRKFSDLPAVIVSSMPKEAVEAGYDDLEPVGYVNKTLSEQQIDLSLFAAELADTLRATMAKRSKK
jgi:two-component system chemotaxis response regulator CheB